MHMAPLIKKCIEDFIEIYKNEPCLWQLKSKDYKDSAKKNVAYTKLVKKLKEIDPQANRESVVRKINALRTTYRKELRRVNESLNSEKEHEPKLWYFDALNFLYEQDSIRSPYCARNTLGKEKKETTERISTAMATKRRSASKATLKKLRNFNNNNNISPNSTRSYPIQHENVTMEEDKNEHNFVSEDEMFIGFQEENEIELRHLEKPTTSARAAALAAATTQVQAAPIMIKQQQSQLQHNTPEKIFVVSSNNMLEQHRLNFKENATENNFLHEVEEQKVVKRSNYMQLDDRFDIFGKHIAIKLRTLPKQQALIAEKLMNDVLFEAEMNMLNLTYKVVSKNVIIPDNSKPTSTAIKNRHQQIRENFVGFEFSNDEDDE